MGFLYTALWFSGRPVGCMRGVVVAEMGGAHFQKVDFYKAVCCGWISTSADRIFEKNKFETIVAVDFSEIGYHLVLSEHISGFSHRFGHWGTKVLVYK